MKRVTIAFALFLFACSGAACSSSSDKPTAPTTTTPIADASADGRIEIPTLADAGDKLSPPAAAISSCNLTDAVGYCLEYTNDASGDLATQNCQSAHAAAGYDGGVSETAGCPTANRVGSCAATIGGTATTYRYYSPKYSTDSAQTDCASLGGGGTFTPN